MPILWFLTGNQTRCKNKKYNNDQGIKTTHKPFHVCLTTYYTCKIRHPTIFTL